MISQPVLVTADWEAPGTFDPAPPTTVTRLRADTLLFRRLWIEAPGGRLVPDLAESVPSGSELRVKLRPGLRWSDGAPLTAADVVYSVGTGVQVLSPTSLVVSGMSRSRLAEVFILPEHRLRGADPAAFFEAPDVVSGPFRLASSATDRLVFDRNPLYGGRPAYLSEIVELLQPSHDAMIAAAQTGEVDLLPHLGPADVGVAIGGLRTVVTRSEREELLQPLGLDPELVAALSLATDRAALVQQALPGGYPIAPGRSLLFAQQLLAGSRPHVRLFIPCNDAVRVKEAPVLAGQWAEAGVTADLSCGTPAAPGISLTGSIEPLPAGAVPLASWPGVRAVSPRLHGFRTNDSSATDFWNAADWWLA